MELWSSTSGGGKKMDYVVTVKPTNFPWICEIMRKTNSVKSLLSLVHLASYKCILTGYLFKKLFLLSHVELCQHYASN